MGNLVVLLLASYAAYSIAKKFISPKRKTGVWGSSRNPVNQEEQFWHHGEIEDADYREVKDNPAKSSADSNS